MRADALIVAIAAAIGLIIGAGPARAYSVYVSNEKGNSITVLDSATLEVTQTIPVGQRPRGIKLTPDDKYLLICASDDDTVQMLDVASREIVGDLPSGPDPELLNIHPSGSTVYVANEDDNLLTAIDIADKKVVAEVEVGVEPEGVGVSPDGKTVVVTSETTNMAHFIDTGWQSEGQHAAFDPTEMLSARDDFLPGVATLRETERVDEIQIEHLRNEQLARLGIDLRLSRGDRGAAPCLIIGQLGG